MLRRRGKAAIVYSIPTSEDSPIGGADAAEVALNGGVRSSVRHGGAEGIRTPDLLSAIQARSQLRHGPEFATRV